MLNTLTLHTGCLVNGMNKAELKAGGTIRVKNNEVIKKGEEILFAYHSSYWSRWGAPRRGRPAKTKHSTQTTARTTRNSAEVAIDHNRVEDPESVRINTTVSEQITEDNGVRVVPQIGRVNTHNRGRRRKERDDPPQRTHKRQATQYMWTATSRDEFNSVQHTSHVQQQSVRQYHRPQRFEQGEGGGVT